MTLRYYRELGLLKVIAGHLKQMDARLDRTSAAVTAMRTLV